LVLDTLDRALRLHLSALLLELGQARQLRLRQVEPVDRVGEAKRRLYATDHESGALRNQLDPDHGDPHVGVDYQPLVEDQLDDVGEPARARRALQVVARGPLSSYGHLRVIPRLLDSNLALFGAATRSRARQRRR